MSIRDVRSIEIDRAGLADAVSRCRKVATSLGLPEGTIKTVSPRPSNNEIDFTLTSEAGASRPVALSAASLGALAVAYLISLRIPVPKQSTKSIDVTDQGLTIVFEFLMPTPPAASLMQRAALPATAVNWR